MSHIAHINESTHPVPCCLWIFENKIVYSIDPYADDLARSPFMVEECGWGTRYDPPHRNNPLVYFMVKLIFPARCEAVVVWDATREN